MGSRSEFRWSGSAFWVGSELSWIVIRIKGVLEVRPKATSEPLNLSEVENRKRCALFKAAKRFRPR